MTFKRPVGLEHRISANYGDKSPIWTWYINDQNKWQHGQKDGLGQHKGIDFACPVGTPILAICDGLIVRSGWESLENPRQGFGQRIRQQLDIPGMERWTVVYGHMSALAVREGNPVKAGDRLGYSGDTGHTTGPHLHIELVDPNGQYHEIKLEPVVPA